MKTHRKILPATLYSLATKHTFEHIFEYMLLPSPQLWVLSLLACSVREKTLGQLFFVLRY